MRLLIETGTMHKAADRAERGGGVASPVEPGLVQRLVQGVKYVVSGVSPGTWFGPLQPISPTAPPEVKGRSWDYPTGYNLQITQRPYEGVSFGTMRALADSYDLMRLVIETRKDQIARMKWRVKQRDSVVGEKMIKPNAAQASHIQQVTEFLGFPDNEHTWDQWVRAVAEDMLVIDAATIYPRKTRGGAPWAFELIDGATIVRKINADGRTPDPPDVAYQQILKGLPATDYSRDELIYFPRNTRTWKAYGYGPVEQVVRFVNLALRRFMWQLQYYTEGNVPESLIGVPETWSVDQIGQFQAYWDDLLEGNTGNRRHAKFVPAGVVYHETKTKDGLSEEDEWLARVVCYAFSVSPQPFVKMMNRATSENAAEMAQKEGLEPLLQWFKNLVDLMIWKYFGFRDIEFRWETDQEVKPLEQAQIDDYNVKNKIKRVNEIRERNGDEPLTDEELLPPQPPPQPGGTGNPTPPGSSRPSGPSSGKEPPMAEKLEKGKKKVLLIDRERDTVIEARAQFERVFKKLFKKGKERVKEMSMDGLDKLSAEDQAKAVKLMAQLDLEGWAVISEASEEILAWITKDGVYQALAQIGLSDEAITETMSQRALDYARSRAAELVGKRMLPDGTIIDNPNPVWSIEESTREMLRSDVATAIEEGWSTKKLQNELVDSYAFSDERAETIARSEVAFADSNGNFIAYQESGVVDGKEAILGSEHDESLEDECDANVAEGVIPLNQPFSSGAQTAPFHPKCVCDVLPHLIGEE